MLELLALLMQQCLFFLGYITGRSEFPPALNRAEEAELIGKLDAGDHNARQELITHNLRLVSHIARKYQIPGYGADDLISIGVIGLIKAVDSFKSASGTPLGTYAARCIENEILMTLRASRKRRGDVSLSDPVGSDGEGNDITYQDILGTDADELENTVIRRVTAEKVPGDSLIFVSGAASAAGILNPLGAFLAIALGACFGNTVAYGIGYFLGSKIYDGSIKWIDQQQMAKTQAFFAKHGKLPIGLARFVPIIRSFAPLVAGAAKMSRLNFEVSGTVGAVLWAGIILAAGHLFGNIPFIKNNLSLILVGGIVLGLAPFVIGYIVKKWRQHPDEK